MVPDARANGHTAPMREADVEIVRSYVRALLRTNLKRGVDGPTGIEYSYLCPSPNEYRWQWFWDSCFHAIAAAHVDPRLAKLELETLVAGQDADGFIGHIQFWGSRFRGLANIWNYGQAPRGARLRRSGLMQPPVLAQAVERVAEIAGDAAFPPTMMRALDRYHSWLATQRARDLDRLLVIVSPYESGMDQSPAYDALMGLSARPNRWAAGRKDRWLDVRNWFSGYDSAKMLRAGRFYVKDALVNALYVDSLATMARLHRQQGNISAADVYARLSAVVLDSLITKMFDRSRGAFFSLLGKEELRSEPLTVGGIVPLVIEQLPADIAKDIVERSLMNPLEFWLRYPAPSVAATEPSFDARGSKLLIWRGPTWVNTNWLLWRGLRRHGFTNAAAHLAESTVSMVARAGLWEFYNPLNGEGLGAKSFAWSGLALDMAG